MAAAAAATDDAAAILLCEHGEIVREGCAQRTGKNYFACSRSRDDQCGTFVWEEDYSFALRAPQCDCKETAGVSRTKKAGPNHDKAFYACSKKYRTPGRCGFFRWCEEQRPKTVDDLDDATKSAIESVNSGGAAAQQQRPADVVEGKFHDVEQNTREWFSMRRGPKGLRLGGSEAGAAIGMVLDDRPPVALYDMLVMKMDKEWITDDDPTDADEDSDRCAHGHRCEPLIADMYSHYRGVKLAEGGYYSHPDPDLANLYGASPDRRVLVTGSNGTVSHLLEIKAPYDRMYKAPKQEHLAQCLYQLWVSGLPFCDYLAVFLDKKEPEKTIPSKTQVLLVRVYLTQEYVDWLKGRLFYFSMCLMKRTRPPMELYRDERFGKSPMPKVKMVRTPIATGAWSVRAATGADGRLMFKPASG